MSDTPRTDAASFGSQVMAHEMVHANFARELERENAELMMPKDSLRTVNEAAKVLNVSRNTIYRFIRAGKLKSVRVGCKVRFRQQDIEDFISGKNSIKDFDDEKFRELQKDKERLDWLLSRAIVQYYPDADPEYLHRIESREDINKAISSGDC
jgi:excisionase family DNA binding protein